MAEAADKSDKSRTSKPRKKQWSRQAWLAAYEDKGTVTAACKHVRISRDTAYRTRHAEPEFAREWDRRESAVTDVLEKTLIEIALQGVGAPQVRALEFALKARKPGMYREHVKVEHGGGYRVTHEKEENIDDEIARFLAANDEISDRSPEAESAGADRAAGQAARS
jgi:hypothetical protein